MYRRFLAALIGLSLLLGPSALAQEGVMSDYRQIRQDITGSFPSAGVTPEDDFVCENGTFRMYFSRNSFIFKVEDTRNGYVWSSGRYDETTEDMSDKWRNFARTLVSAEVVHMNTLTTASALPDFDALEVTFETDGLRAVIPLKGVDITVEMSVLLTEAGLRVEMPDEGIVHGGSDYRLLSLMPLPFFGAASQGEGDGYLFIPDGCGALIRFDTVATAATAYEQPIYGVDESMIWVMSENVVTANNATPMQAVRLPVMGIVHGARQNAVLMHVADGAEYASVCASSADMITGFYYTGPKFAYATLYIQPDGTGTGFLMITQAGLPVDAVVDYYLLEGEDAAWTGMARIYRDILFGGGEEPRQQPGDVPVLVNALMAETVKEALGERAAVLTTEEDIRAWYQAYLDQGVSNVVFSLEGLSKGGISRQKAHDFGVSTAVGSAASFGGLSQWIAEQGGTLLLGRDIVGTYRAQASGDSLRYGVYRQYTEQAAGGWLDAKRYFHTAEQTAAMGEALAGAAQAWGGINVAGLGATLLSDYKDGIAKTRRDEMENSSSLLNRLESDTDYLLLQMPNAYAAGYGRGIYDVPLSHSGMIFETDAVPFVQMLYAGQKEMFSARMIPGNNERSLLLRMIAFGTYPQYTFIGRPEPLLEHSNANDLYSAVFDQLFDASLEEYGFINDILSRVRGLAMVDYQVPMPDVVLVTYSDNTQIAVNFSKRTVSVRGISIAPESAAVLADDVQ